VLSPAPLRQLFANRITIAQLRGAEPGQRPDPALARNGG
jgi:hypothetical protein